MTAPLLRLRGLTKRFGRRTALAGLDLEVRAPTMLGVVGPDGAGKTTLLRALAGLLEIEAAEAQVLGFDLRRDVTALKARIGYVPQAFGLPRELTVLENLRFTARLHGIAPGEGARRAAALLERTGLAPFADRPAAALSGGMKQKLAVASALLPDPAILLLDEPTAGVDVVARGEIRALLDEARREALVVLGTSYLDEAETCERLVYLDGGRLVADGTPAALRARVPLELYRVWGDDGRGIARAARALPYVRGARAAGLFARIEVPMAGSPGIDRLEADLRPAGAQFVERTPVDMETTLLAAAGGLLA